MRRSPTILCGLAAALLAGVALPPARVATAAPLPIVVGPMDWPTYGHDLHRTFEGRSSLDHSSVPTLARAWFFPTGDATTANPIEVGGTVYVGSWDGNFYAISAVTGAQRWKFTLKSQPAVSPQPGNRQPTDIMTDGGMVTAAAYLLPGSGSRPDLVIFGGGYTLYALRAADGSVFWEHDYTGRPDKAPNPAHDGTRIFSSPAVVGNKVLFAADADGSQGYRGYLVAADVATGVPLWTRELDVDTTGRVLNDGCGNVWASPTIIETLGLEIAPVSDCHFRGTLPYHERVLAVRIADGTLAWAFTPPRLQHADPDCDYDFGATANLGVAADGTPTFLGVGGKDGTYYSLDPATGALRWMTNVVFGGFAGGFIGTAAYDGQRVVGATALGDFGRFESNGPHPCDPTNPADLPLQEPSVHAFDAATGKVIWQGVTSQSFGPTATANGMVFVCASLDHQMQARDSATGQLLASVPLPANCDSGTALAGNAVFLGTGSSEQGSPDGMYAFTPLGVAPAIPAGNRGAPAPPTGSPAPASAVGLAGLPGTTGAGTGTVAVAVVAGGAAALGRRRRRRRV